MSTMGNFLHGVRRNVNRILGLDVIRVSGQYTLGAHIGKVLDKYDIDAIIDVGANEGDFAGLVRGLGFKGAIYSFEPVAGAFDVLARRAQGDANWHAYNFALGSREGRAQINVSRFSQFSSILDATNYGNTWKNMKVEHKQDVVVRTLDNLHAESVFGAGSRFLLKMDTQGFDIEVFKGATEFLSKVICLQSELSLIPLYQGMPGYLESLRTYNEAGFLASGFYPITRHASLALNEVDCMMVKPASAAASGIATIDTR